MGASVLGDEGADVIEDPSDGALPVGSRGMFIGPHGLCHKGAWQAWPAALTSWAFSSLSLGGVLIHVGGRPRSEAIGA